MTKNEWSNTSTSQYTCMACTETTRLHLLKGDNK